MTTYYEHPRSRLTNAVFALLNPIPFGFFVAVLIFDVVYACNANVFWVKSAAFLNAIGLIFAIIPRLINLVHVWFPPSGSTRTQKIEFWLYGIAILIAILNAFIHSRDAYASMPEGVLLSAITVGLIATCYIISVVCPHAAKGVRHA